MTMEKGNQNAELKKTIDRQNLIIIALLCSTTLTPALIFFTTGVGQWQWLLVFIIVCFVFSRVPASYYNRFQLSQHLAFYKKLQVHHFKRYATNGDLINKRIRRKFPQHRNIYNYNSFNQKLKETYIIEKSHSVLFLFCGMTSIYAFIMRDWGTAILLAMGNFIFNYYPNLLQQYNRIRYKKAMQSYENNDNK